MSATLLQCIWVPVIASIPSLAGFRPAERTVTEFSESEFWISVYSVMLFKFWHVRLECSGTREPKMQSHKIVGKSIASKAQHQRLVAYEFLILAVRRASRALAPLPFCAHLAKALQLHRDTAISLDSERSCQGVQPLRLWATTAAHVAHATQ